MRSLRAFLYFSLGVMIALVWGIKSANAQVMYPTAGGIIATEVVGPFSSWAAGIRAGTSAAVTEGVKLTASGVGSIGLSNAGKIGATVVVDGVVQRSAIAAATATFLKWGRITNPAILTASLAYQVYKDSGYQTCAAPDFFCKTGATAVYPVGPWTGSYGSFSSTQSDPDAVCNALLPSLKKDYPYTTQIQSASKMGIGSYTGSSAYQGDGTKIQYAYRCKTLDGSQPGYEPGAAISQTTYGCPATYSFSSGMCRNSAPPPGPAYSDAELEQAFNDKMNTDSTFAKKYWDAVSSDAARNAGSVTLDQLVPPSSKITPGAISSTQLPPVEVSKETINNADGTTSTRTTTGTTTVTPQVQGTTVSDAKLTASSSTVYNTTTVNNTTGATTTNSTTINNQTSAQESTKKDDYGFTDSGMPDVPSLYTQKYPDGIAGAWRDNKPDVSSTGFFAGVKSMFPSFAGGSCPSFSLPLSIGAKLGNFGTQPFNVPCSIYDFIGLVMLVTAAFTARKIIF